MSNEKRKHLVGQIKRKKRNIISNAFIDPVTIINIRFFFFAV